MTAATILSIVLELLKAAPQLVEDVEALIAAFKGGGPTAAKDLIASKVASNTAALENALQTPLVFK